MMNTLTTMHRRRSCASLLLLLSTGLLAACGGGEEGSSSSNGSTSASNGTSSNGTTNPSNGGTSNGTTATSNGTTATSNGTTSTSNGTTSTSNGTTFVGVGLSIDNTDARSCELVIEDPSQVLKGVDFADSVVGRAIPRGQRTAIAFLPRADAAFEDGAVSLQVRADASPDELSVLAAHCYDRDGNTLDTASITILR